MKIFFTLRLLLLITFLSLFISHANAQLIITNNGTAFTENFNGMGASAVATLPTGFKIGTDWSTGVTTTTLAYGSTGAGAVTGSSSGGIINWANGVTASSTDRALGFLNTGSFTSPRSIILKFTNNTGSTIGALTVSFDYEKYRSGSRQFDWTFFHGPTSTAGIAATAGDQSYPADAANTTISNPPTTISRTVVITGLTIANGADYYLRWTFTGLGGSTNGQGIGIDNFSITSTGTISANANLSNLGLSAGTLTPAFSSSTTSYTASVLNSVSTITLTPTASDVNSTITVNGTTVVSGAPSQAIALAVGLNTITTVVTAQNGTTTKTYTVIVDRAAGGVPTLNASSLTDFGNVCTNVTAGPNSFILDGTNLDGSSISLAALDGFTFSETSGGVYTSTLSFSYTGSSFTNKSIYVKFTPTAVQSYNGNLVVSGGGVSSYLVPITGSGINTTASVTTGTNIASGSTATLNGIINSVGCNPVTAYGIEYSITSGFADGTGTQLPSSNLSGGNFSSQLTGLIANKRYYYKAFVTTGGGSVYGLQQAFNAPPVPVLLASQPSLSYTETFADIANWANFFAGGIGSEHFSQAVGSATGTIPDPAVVTSNSVFSSGPSGGVQRGTDQITPLTPTQSIVLLSTGSSDNTSSAAFDFYMDFTGVNAGTLSFDYQTLNNGTAADNRKGSLRVYATINGTTFTEITNILNFTNNAPITGSKTNILLPAFFNNSATARLRFYYYNGTGGSTGSRPKISIDNLIVTAVATTPCVAPTAPASTLTFGTITDVTIAGSFTAASSAADQYLVIASTNNTLTSNPMDGQTYNVGDNVGDGTVVAKGSSTSFTATGLSASTTYYFFVFPLNAVCTGGPLYYIATPLTGQATTVAGLPTCTTPTLQPTALTFGTSGTNTIQGSFTATTADEYLIVRSASSTLSVMPANAQAYHVGDLIGNGVVVQRNNSTSFTANGLLPNTSYYFFVFSANSQNCINGPAYNTDTPLTGSQATIPLPPCTTPATQPFNLALSAANTAIAGNFATVSGADAYLVVRSTSAALSATPIDNTDYAIGDAVGAGVVVSNSSNNSFLTTSLAPATTYYFSVFAENKNCSGGTKYLAASPLTASKTTLNTTSNSYYFGTLHSHSDYSDGNQDHPGYKPTDDYTYAMTAQCMDYLGISEHNHFSSPDNPGNKITTYHQGITEANNFTTAHPSFLALYGMEWGVISGGGHVVVYGDGMDNLFGWESGSGGWGPTNNYDVYVAKNDYTGQNGLFKTVNDYVSQNSFASLAHPNLTDYNNLANMPYNAVADSAITAVAVESGPATSTNTTYSNPGFSMGYLWYYQLLLAKGYHLGPVIDHDNHNTTFGHTTYSRTGIVAPALTEGEIINAMRNMHFYATQDCDTKVDFSLNARIMGSVISDRYAPVISVTLTDGTTSTSGAIIRLMYGVPGSGSVAVQIDSIIGNSYTYIDNNLPNGSTGYYYIDITNGTSRIITAPVWYSRTDNNGNILPVNLLSFTAKKSGTAVQLNWTTAQEINTKEFIIERSSDGVHFTGIATVPATGGTTNKNYQIMDGQPYKGDNFYRLRMVDKDGKSDYSKTVKLNFSKQFTAYLFPNPASNKLNLNLANNFGPVTIQLIDMTGKVVKTLILRDVTNTISIADLSKGLYLVKVQGNTETYTEKIIVE